MVVAPQSVAVPVEEKGIYEVRLLTTPTADVVVSVASGATGTATVSVSSLTFTPTNWWEYQQVVLTGVAAGSTTVSHTVSGGDYGANGVTAADVAVTVAGSSAVVPIDWEDFTAGVPDNHYATEAMGWLVTGLKYMLNNWWNVHKNFDAQSSSTYLDFAKASNAGSGFETLFRESSSMALGLAVALSTGAYDDTVTGVTESTAREKALKLIRSLAYAHRINRPEDQTTSTWCCGFQSRLFAAHAGLAGWLMWEDLSVSDRELVKKMIASEASNFLPTLYYRDASGTITRSGNTQAEEMGLELYVLSLGAVMMPNHPDADMWRTSNIEMMLAAFSHPDDVSSNDVYHGHSLSKWIDGSNLKSDGTAVNHGIVHPDYMVSGVIEFNSALIYYLADLPIPRAARFNADRIIEALVELDFTPGGGIRSPGGTMWVAGTLCEGTDPSVVASCMEDAENDQETFEAGHSRGCQEGPPGSPDNVYYPQGSSWSTLRRPNHAQAAAHADVFGFNSRIADSTLHGDYWFGCFVRDVRAMQARRTDGRTWNSGELNYHGREGQSVHYAAKAWLAYWMQHQAGDAGFTYENDTYPLEFNRIISIEADDSSNTIRGSSFTRTHGYFTHNKVVVIKDSGDANSVTITGLDAPTSGIYPIYITYNTNTHEYNELTLTVDGRVDDVYNVPLPRNRKDGLGSAQLAAVRADVYLNAGNNDLTIVRKSNVGTAQVRIDRIILSDPTPVAVRAVVVSPTSLGVVTGAAGTYTVMLATEPTASVTVTPTSSATDTATVSGALTFTTATWATAQTVTVSGVAAGSVSVSHAVAGGDYASNNVTADSVAVTVAARVPWRSRRRSWASSLAPRRPIRFLWRRRRPGRRDGHADQRRRRARRRCRARWCSRRRTGRPPRPSPSPAPGPAPTTITHGVAGGDYGTNNGRPRTPWR